MGLEMVFSCFPGAWSAGSRGWGCLALPLGRQCWGAIGWEWGCEENCVPLGSDPGREAELRVVQEGRHEPSCLHAPPRPTGVCLCG